MHVADLHFCEGRLWLLFSCFIFWFYIFSKFSFSFRKKRKLNAGRPVNIAEWSMDLIIPARK